MGLLDQFLTDLMLKAILSESVVIGSIHLACLLMRWRSKPPITLRPCLKHWNKKLRRIDITDENALQCYLVTLFVACKRCSLFPVFPLC